jgi:hypothetical protein
MVSIEDIKKAAISKSINEKINEKSNNIDCTLVIDVIFGKIMHLMEVDDKLPWYKKKAVLGGAKSLKEPVKDYLMDMPPNEAADVVNKIRNIICK